MKVVKDNEYLVSIVATGDLELQYQNISRHSGE